MTMLSKFAAHKYMYVTNDPPSAHEPPGKLVRPDFASYKIHKGDARSPDLVLFKVKKRIRRNLKRS